MLQRLPIAHTQVKTGNASENLLNEISQIINSLYQAKETTKKQNNQYDEFNTDIIKNRHYIYDCMFLSCHVRVLEWIHTL